MTRMSAAYKSALFGLSPELISMACAVSSVVSSGEAFFPEDKSGLLFCAIKTSLNYKAIGI